MISDRLKALKLQKNITAQELSDLTNTPLSTINKILSGQTENPGFDAVSGMILAMGGSVDEMLGNTNSRTVVASDPGPDARGETISFYREAMGKYEVWLRRLFACCGGLTLLLIVLLLFDIVVPAIGRARHA